ncbi:hypothetical protein [Ktedonosporobacter rubrisoli]|uniref:hypothetical protein n=1 Tax=Ktedonosporobacter rubrisoli TaxID=2509675 RepID=UPI001F5CA4E8|nr:hypothetical protein [Ktedonosporobacter rubrisoli]
MPSSHETQMVNRSSLSHGLPGPENTRSPLRPSQSNLYNPRTQIPPEQQSFNNRSSARYPAFGPNQPSSINNRSSARYPALGSGQSGQFTNRSSARYPTPGASQPSSINNRSSARYPAFGPAQQAFGQNPQSSLSNPNQRTGFYHDATEALELPPTTTGRLSPQGYQQSQAPGTSVPHSPSWPGIQAMPAAYGSQSQHFQASVGNYAPPVQPQPPVTPGVGYDYSNYGSFPSRAQKSSSSPTALIICVTILVLVISTVGLTALFIKNSSQGQNTAAAPTTTAVATTAPEATPTMQPSPTEQPSPTAMPSPSAVPTVPADNGFLWCGSECTGYGFSTEYPANWQPGAAANNTGVQFSNPAQPNTYAAFKAPGPTSSPASDIVSNDLQENFASQQGYTPPTSMSTTTISGETWATTVAYYQGDTEKERVAIYATVHQGSAYIIELQAPDSSFDSINTQFFSNMLSRYQFITGTPTA